MNEVTIKQAKTDRHTAKSAFMRVGKALVHGMEHNRPPNEVRQAVIKLQEADENLVTKHEDYVKHIEDDEAYKTEEKWL